MNSITRERMNMSRLRSLITSHSDAQVAWARAREAMHSGKPQNFSRNRISAKRKIMILMRSRLQRLIVTLGTERSMNKWKACTARYRVEFKVKSTRNALNSSMEELLRTKTMERVTRWPIQIITYLEAWTLALQEKPHCIPSSTPLKTNYCKTCSNQTHKLMPF